MILANIVAEEIDAWVSDLGPRVGRGRGGRSGGEGVEMGAAEHV